MIDRDTLIAYLEGRLPESDRARVEREWETDPDALKQFVEQKQIDQALRAFLAKPEAQERVKESILAVVRGESQEHLKQRVLTSVGDGPNLLSRIRDWLTVPRLVFVTACAVVLICAVMMRDSEKPVELAATIEGVTGQVTLVRGSETQPGTNGFRSLPGDVVRVSDEGAATLAFADGTRLQLLGGSQIAFVPGASPQKSFALTAGALVATVAKQPTRSPMLIRTPQAKIEVIGTTFTLDVTAVSTRLDVEKGRVQVSNGVNRQPVQVAAGQYLLAAPNTPWRARALPSVGTVGSGRRDPGVWPFAPDSVWNQSIGSNAKYVAVDTPEWKPGSGAGLRGPHFLVPIIYSETNDPPMRIVSITDGAVLDEVRIPEALKVDLRPRHRLMVVDPTHRWGIEMLNTRLLPNGDLECGRYWKNDLTGPGYFDEPNGARRSGMSAFGGMIRRGEFKHGISHALALSMPASALSRRTASGKPWVWPACTAIGKDRTNFSENGNLHLGALLAIPPNINVAELGVGSSGPAYEVAKALQDYGAYIADIELTEQEDRMCFFAEWSVLPELPVNIDDVLSTVIGHLQVVENNSPENIGGGGTPRRSPAPDFSQP